MTEYTRYLKPSRVDVSNFNAIFLRTIILLSKLAFLKTLKLMNQTWPKLLYTDKVDSIFHSGTTTSMISAVPSFKYTFWISFVCAWNFQCQYIEDFQKHSRQDTDQLEICSLDGLENGVWRHPKNGGHWAVQWGASSCNEKALGRQRGAGMFRQEQWVPTQRLGEIVSSAKIIILYVPFYIFFLVREISI